MDSILESIEMAVAALFFCIAVLFLMKLLVNLDSFRENAIYFGTETEDCLYLEL